MRVGKKIIVRYIVRRGDEELRYVEENGKKVPVTKKTPEAVKVRVESRDLYGYWREGGKEKAIRFKNCRSPKAAMARLVRHLQKIHEHKAGVGFHPDEEAKAQERAAAGWRLHLDAWRTYLLKKKGRTPKHVHDQVRSVERVGEALKAKTLADFTAGAVSRVCLELGTSERLKYQKARDVAARTKDKRLGAVCQFFRWLCKPDSGPALTASPLAGLEKISGKTVVTRRALELDELQRFLDAARRRPLHNLLERLRRGTKEGAEPQLSQKVRDQYEELGVLRSLLYKTATMTLIRRATLMALTVDMLRLDASPPQVFLPGALVKRKKDIVKPLHPAVVEDLRALIQRRKLTGPDRLFPLKAEGLREFRKDLAFAGIAEVDTAGRRVDFHSLKRSGITALARARVPISLVQEYAEHVDLRTTKKYIDEAQRMDEVLAHLPQLK